MGFDTILPPAYTGKFYNTGHFSTYTPTMESCNQNLGSFMEFYAGQHMPSKEHTKKISSEGMMKNQIDSQSMPVLVIGGFVGSKSQAGGSSHRGREIRGLIWDLIWDKMKALTAYQMSNYPVNFCKKPADCQRRDASNLNMGDKSKEEKSNKSYAEATKGSPEPVLTNACDMNGQVRMNRPETLSPLSDEPDMSCYNARLSDEKMDASETLATVTIGDQGCDILNVELRTPCQEKMSNGLDESQCPDLICPGYDYGWKATTNDTVCRVAPIKIRTLSDCSVDSDDSFIVFDGTDHSDDILQLESDDDYSDDENSDDETDEVPFFFYESCSVYTPSENYNITSANKRWNLSYASVEEKPKKTSSKKVTFAKGKDLVKVKTLVVWAFAHEACRKPYWDQVARDRERFNTRINTTALVLNPVLDQQHRDRVYNERFKND